MPPTEHTVSSSAIPPTIAAAIALLLGAACGAASRPDPSTGPAIDPVLARAKQAGGGARWDAVVALDEAGTIEAGGMRGAYTALEDLRAGRSASRYTLGPVDEASGHDGATSWSRAPGGEVTLGTGPGERRGAATAAWLTSRSYWFPDRRPGRTERRPDRVEGVRRFHVVRAAPDGGRPVELWFDGATGHLDRQIEVDGGVTTTTRLSDYRQVDGLVLPFELRSGTGDPRYDAVIQVSRYRLDPPVEAAAYSPPRPRLDDVSFAGGAHRTTLPFELVNNHIYVTAEVDGRPVRLLVDTGGANILTPAAAAALGLESQGAVEGRGAGQKSQDVGFARAGSLRLGDVTIRRPLFYTLDLGPLSPVEGLDLAGLVGYEIFHRFVVRIDYAGRTLTLIDPRHFDRGEAHGEALPFTWHGQTPVVTATLDGIRGQFAVDTGSRASVTMHAGFTRAHRLVARYRAAGERITGWGVGGPVRSRPARVGDLALGSFHVRHVAAELFEGDKGAFADRDHAGNIGSGLLRRFTVTFDYPGSRMILEPNRDFAVEDTHDRSGLWLNARVDRAPGFDVIEVVPGGPAARAGLAAGDVILSVGGEPAVFTGLGAARARLRQAAVGSRIEVVYERRGGRRTATVVLADATPAR